MFEKDKKRINERYNNRINKLGTNIDGLASGTEERRNLQYKILSEVGDLDKKRVLDLGCGFGDFYLYTKKIGLEIDYTGIDINPLIISKAKEKIPEVNFIHGDILEENIPNFDYIVSASTFNNLWKEVSNYELIYKIFERCYDLSNIGFAIDFVTNYVDYKVDDEVFYYSPEKVFNLAKHFTKRVVLRHDYPLFQFCMYAYKDFLGWKKCKKTKK